ILSNIQALGYSPLQSVGYSQMLGAVTAWDADDAASNMGLFAGQNLRLADRAGRVSEWAAISDDSQSGVDKYSDVRRFLEMWKDPSYRPLLRAAVFPTTFETLENGGMSQQMLTSMSLRDLLGEPGEGSIYSRMLGGNGRRDLLRYFSQVDAQTVAHGRSFGLTRMAADLGAARTSTASRTLDSSTEELMAPEAMVDVARLVRTLAAYPNREEALKMVQEAVDNIHRSFVVDNAMDPSTQDQIRKTLEASLEAKLPANPTQEQIDRANEHNALIARVISGDSNTLRDYMQAYLIDWNSPSLAVARQQQLLDIVRNQPSIAESAVSDAVRMLRTAT